MRKWRERSSRNAASAPVAGSTAQRAENHGGAAGVMCSYFLAHLTYCKWLSLLYQDWPCEIAYVTISPTRRESQENGNVSINAFNLALNQFPFHKAFYVTFNWVFRYEIEYPFVERDHCLHRCLLNCLPKFINCFRFNELVEIHPSQIFY